MNISPYRPGSVAGIPTTVGGYKQLQPQHQVVAPKPSVQPEQPKENSLPRALNYQADYSGCGYWRMSWPEQLLTAYQHMVVTGTTCMIRDQAFYGNLKSVRLQRQASPVQLQFFKELRHMADKTGFHIIYEIDDVVMSEDIPDYNKYKFAFEPKEIRDSVIEMMKMSDEMTVTNDFMRDYYMSKSGNTNVTVIPNYPPRFWLDGFYDEDVLMKNYDRHVKKRKKPRVLYAASGAHFDVENKVGQVDDFVHVRDYIRKTVNKFQWVFIGAYPPPLGDLVRAGKIEFHPWAPLYDLPRLIYSLKVNCMYAPLLDTTFNRCKSNIKYVEACAYGLPVVCQDMVTYSDAMHKFTTGDDLIDQLTEITKDKQSYMKICRKMRLNIDNMWLENEDNIGKYKEVYCTRYGSSDRKLLSTIN